MDVAVAAARPRPFGCDLCAKHFATKFSLKSHLRVHTGVRPFACTYCDKRFKTSGDVHKHERTHTGERPFRCSFCEKGFTTSNILKVHLRTHTGERPYACESCPKTFASHTNLKNHKRTHSGERPYSCDHPDCGRRFSEYSSLFKHQLTHNPNSKPWKCHVCEKSFRQESTLELHKRTIHQPAELEQQPKQEESIPYPIQEPPDGVIDYYQEEEQQPQQILQLEAPPVQNVAPELPQLEINDILRAKVVFYPQELQQQQQQQQVQYQQQQPEPVVQQRYPISNSFSHSESSAFEAPISEGLTSLLGEYGGLFEPLSLAWE